MSAWLAGASYEIVNSVCWICSPHLDGCSSFIVFSVFLLLILTPLTIWLNILLNIFKIFFCKSKRRFVQKQNNSDKKSLQIFQTASLVFTILRIYANKFIYKYKMPDDAQWDHQKINESVTRNKRYIYQFKNQSSRLYQCYFLSVYELQSKLNISTWISSEILTGVFTNENEVFKWSFKNLL